MSQAINSQHILSFDIVGNKLICICQGCPCKKTVIDAALLGTTQLDLSFSDEFPRSQVMLIVGNDSALKIILV
jgi:hypothetical protein